MTDTNDHAPYDAEPLRVPQTLDEWTLPIIRMLLEAGCIEDGRFDWKEKFPDRRDAEDKDRLVQAATALANAGGGFIVFGVKDKGPVAERIVGVVRDNEFGAEVARQFQRADPPLPHRLQNPPLRFDDERCIYVVQVLALAAPHAAVNRAFYVRSGGGTSEPIRTHQLRTMFRYQDVLDAPGLNEIRRIGFGFLHGSDWDAVRTGLATLAYYAAKGSHAQQLAVLETLSDLAIRVRQRMPDGIIIAILGMVDEALLSMREASTETRSESFALAAEVAGHVGYDATLYLHDGFAVHDSARLLSELLYRANELQREDLIALVVEEFNRCIDAARRVTPEPWLDAIRWYEHKRDNPSRGPSVPPAELNEVEARLLGVHDSGG